MQRSSIFQTSISNHLNVRPFRLGRRCRRGRSTTGRVRRVLKDLSSVSEEQRFQLLVQAVVDYAIYMLDAEGHVATWNAGARRFKGYEAAEIIGQHFSRFFPPEDRERGLPQDILDTAEREGRFEGEGYRVRKDGTRFLAHVVVDAIRDEDGGLIGFAKVTRDITERRETERALFASEQRFRMLVEGVRDYAIYMLDADGRITNWNAGAEAIKGYSADEIIGEHFSRFYTEEDRAAGEPQRALETALREGTYEREARRVRKDGTLFWANVVIDPIFDETGNHVGFAKITRDVTERRAAQEELDKARSDLAQAQKLQALGELTGGIAHDFNNLMTVIAGSADFLIRRPDLPDEKRSQYLHAIASTAERATALTNHLLAFGRRQTLRPEVLDVNIRLDAASELLTRTLGSTIALDLELAPQPACVEADATQLDTAILNAVINARDAMPGGGRITLRTTFVDDSAGGWVRLDIADTGTGMAEEVAGRAFEPFFTTKEIGKGTGLGLSQIHGFAAQSGGRAEIDSKPAAGTTLSIVLPRASGRPVERGEDATVPSLPKGLRVLLIEDNASVRQFAHELLVDLGCRVTAAENASEALERMNEDRVDIVFSDVVMPGMSGLELARTLAQEQPEVPVLLASGYSAELVGSDGRFPVISKPYGPTDLGRAIAALIADRERAA